MWLNDLNMTQRYVRSYTLRTSLNNNVYLSNAFKIKDVSHFRKKYVHVICFLLLLYQQRRIQGKYGPRYGENGEWKYGQFTPGHIGHTKMPWFELSM
jgi:hypothetical protein